MTEFPGEVYSPPVKRQPLLTLNVMEAGVPFPMIFPRTYYHVRQSIVHIAGDSCLTDKLVMPHAIPLGFDEKLAERGWGGGGGGGGLRQEEWNLADLFIYSTTKFRAYLQEILGNTWHPSSFCFSSPRQRGHIRLSLVNLYLR